MSEHTIAAPPAASWRGWIQVGFNILALIAAALVVLNANSDAQTDLNDLVRYAVMIGVPLLGGFLLSASLNVDPASVAIVLCLPIGIGIWAYSQQFRDNTQMRDAIMTLGSGLIGVFLGGLGTVTQRSSQRKRSCQ